MASVCDAPLTRLTKATRWAQRAVDIDPADADAQAVLANATHRRAIWPGARMGSPGAVQPSSLHVHGYGGGGPAERWPIRRNAGNIAGCDTPKPTGPYMSSFLRFIAMSYYYEGDFANAAEAAKRAVAFQPDNPMQYRWLAASLGQVGRPEEAREALRTAIDLSPDTFDIYVRNRPPWFRPQDHELMLNGLRKAGWDG
jgi:tetratricopeptide (TPR) repeat protein